MRELTLFFDFKQESEECDQGVTPTHKEKKRRSLPPPRGIHITNFSLISQAHIEPINYSKFIFLLTARERLKSWN